MSDLNKKKKRSFRQAIASRSKRSLYKRRSKKYLKKSLEHEARANHHLELAAQYKQKYDYWNGKFIGAATVGGVFRAAGRSLTKAVTSPFRSKQQKADDKLQKAKLNAVRVNAPPSSAVQSNKKILLQKAYKKGTELLEENNQKRKELTSIVKKYKSKDLDTIPLIELLELINEWQKLYPLGSNSLRRTLGDSRFEKLIFLIQKKQTQDRRNNYVPFLDYLALNEEYNVQNVNIKDIDTFLKKSLENNNLEDLTDALLMYKEYFTNHPSKLDTYRSNIMSILKARPRWIVELRQRQNDGFKFEIANEFLNILEGQPLKSLSKMASISGVSDDSIISGFSGLSKVSGLSRLPSLSSGSIDSFKSASSSISGSSGGIFKHFENQKLQKELEKLEKEQTQPFSVTEEQIVEIKQVSETLQSELRKAIVHDESKVVKDIEKSIEEFFFSLDDKIDQAKKIDDTANIVTKLEDILTNITNFYTIPNDIKKSVQIFRAFILYFLDNAEFNENITVKQVLLDALPEQLVDKAVLDDIIKNITYKRVNYDLFKFKKLLKDRNVVILTKQNYIMTTDLEKIVEQVFQKHHYELPPMNFEEDEGIEELKPYL